MPLPLQCPSNPTEGPVRCFHGEAKLGPLLGSTEQFTNIVHAYRVPDEHGNFEPPDIGDIDHYLRIVTAEVRPLLNHYRLGFTPEALFNPTVHTINTFVATLVLLDERIMSDHAWRNHTVTRGEWSELIRRMIEIGNIYLHVCACASYDQGMPETERPVDRTRLHEVMTATFDKRLRVNSKVNLSAMTTEDRRTVKVVTFSEFQQAGVDEVRKAVDEGRNPFEVGRNDGLVPIRELFKIVPSEPPSNTWSGWFRSKCRSCERLFHNYVANSSLVQSGIIATLVAIFGVAAVVMFGLDPRIAPILLVFGCLAYVIMKAYKSWCDTRHGLYTPALRAQIPGQ